MSESRTAVILVNYRNWADTEKCIDSLRSLTVRASWIVVVNNDPSFPPPQGLSRDDVSVVEAGGNVGFAAGCNLGAEFASGLGASLLWFLNNDTVVSPDALIALQDVYRRRCDGFGGCTSLTVFMDRPQMVQWAEGFILPLATGVRIRGEVPLRCYEGRSESRVSFMPGCSLLVETSTFREVGGFAAPFFMYFEDADLSATLRERGARMWLCPRSVVYHRGGGSGGGIWSDFGALHYARNRVWFARAHGWPLASAVITIGVHLAWSLRQYGVHRRNVPWRRVFKGLMLGLFTSPAT